MAIPNATPFNIVASIVALFVATVILYSFSKQKSPRYRVPVVPVHESFDWSNQTQLKSYPFTGKPYQLTMGIKRLDPQDWLLIEDSYLKSTTEKSRILDNNHNAYPPTKNLRASTLLESPEADCAIREWYDITVQYMCDKYPMIFSESTSKNIVYNTITKASFPKKASSRYSREQLLDILGKNIEEDFIILLKESPESEYFFKAGVFAFAAGFDPIDKFNKPLTAIHSPIPGYETKLKRSMNKYFDRIQPGEFVLRSNFSVQTHTKYYVDDSNKGYHWDNETSKPLDYDLLDFDNQVHYRSERQTLTKLPQSGAVVFTIRTYLHPFSKFKHEYPEDGKRLLASLNGLPDDIAEYKNAVEWGPAAKRYLSEIAV